MVHAWEQDATGVTLPHLWTPGLERRPSLLPDPLLGVAANVATYLSGYRAVGRLDQDGEHAAIIFERRLGEEADDGTGRVPGRDRSEGLLVAWNRQAPTPRAELNLYLGEAPVLHDVWGNSRPLAADAAGRHRLSLTDTPSFISGIDPQLALFRSSFRLDRPFVASTQTPHLRTVRLSTPWPVTVSGQFQFTGPDGWTLRPQRHSFSIAPGDTVELPVAIKFPVQEIAGRKRLTADFRFSADRRYDVRFTAPLTLGLEGLEFEASLAVEPGAAASSFDATVTCILTNTGGDELTLNLFALLPGHARKERLIPRLEPGQSVVRQFRFNNAAAALTQHDIRLGARETNGPAVLNHRVGLNSVE
jgi:hypothetical protein